MRQGLRELLQFLHRAVWINGPERSVPEIDGVERDVNFFRVGRVALLYQTTDTEISGAWDQASRSWVPLERGEYRNAIMKGLRIARKEASIDLLNLPIAAPEAK